jgi:S-adenosylmethionine decarboxylase
MRSGKHLLADLFGIETSRLQDKKKLMKVLCAALRSSKFDIIRRSIGHQFHGGGQGVTGFVLLAQSHAAFHSYPEHGYLALDIYCCGTHDPRPAVQAVAKFLQPAKVTLVSHRRGLKVSRPKS